MSQNFSTIANSKPVPPAELESKSKLCNITTKKDNLLVEIPLLPQPKIQCRDLSDLENADFVNIVLEKPATGELHDKTFFRVSDEKNKEVCKVLATSKMPAHRNRKGVEYLECQDVQGKCILLIAYPVGLGEVALLTPKGELIGECQSVVEFICLSVKVKYNFYDMNGNRLMKMTALMTRELDDKNKFIVIVKRPKQEKLALIKMGALKTCCTIKFKRNDTSILERLQIISLWVGFMDNELKDVETPLLLERHAVAQEQKIESRRKRFIKAEVDDNKNNDGDTSQTSEAVNKLDQNDSPKNFGKDLQRKLKPWMTNFLTHFTLHQNHSESSNKNDNDATFSVKFQSAVSTCPNTTTECAEE